MRRLYQRGGYLIYAPPSILMAVDMAIETYHLPIIPRSARLQPHHRPDPYMYISTRYRKWYRTEFRRNPRGTRYKLFP